MKTTNDDSENDGSNKGNFSKGRWTDEEHDKFIQGKF